MFLQTTQAWGDVFTSSLQSLWIGFMSYVPSLVIAVLIFIIGWVLGSVVGKAFAHVIGVLNVDRIFKGTGAHETFEKMGMKFSVGSFVGELFRWFIVIAFLMTSLEIVGLIQVTQFLREVVLGYLPQVIVATFILIVATLVSSGVSKIVSGSAKAADIKSANLLGAVARYAIWIFALLIALSELGVAPQFMQIFFIGIVAMLSLAGGLAFGLGGRDAAARVIEKVKEDVSSRM